MDELHFRISGMRCRHCLEAAVAAIERVDGVDRVEVELESGWALVHGDGFSLASVRAAAEAAGHDPAL